MAKTKIARFGKPKDMASLRVWRDGRVKAYVPDYADDEPVPAWAAFIVAAFNLYAFADTRDAVIRMYIAKREEIERARSPIVVPGSSLVDANGNPLVRH